MPFSISLPFEIPYFLLLCIWLGIMAALLLFLLVVLFRTSRIKPQTLPEPRRPEYDPNRAAHAAESLSAAISFATVSYPDGTQRDYNQFVAFRRYLRTRYPLCHSQMEFEQVSGFSMLYCRRAQNPAAAPVLFCGHSDVIPASGEWKYPPFEGRVEDGYVWGRGAIDCKGNVICLFESLESLFSEGREPNRDIYLALGHDHELGGEEGARQIARLLAARGISFDFVLDEGNPISDSIFSIGCPVAEIGVSEKGNLNVRLTAGDVGGHSARPPAHTSLGILSEALCRVEYKPCRARLTPLVKDTLLALAPYLPYKTRMYIANRSFFRKKLLSLLCSDSHSAALTRTTVTPVMATSGLAPDMLPDASEAILNIRLMTGDTERLLLSWLDALTMDLGIESEVILSTPPSRLSDYHCDVYHTLLRSINDVFHEIPVVPVLTCTSSDARYYEPLSGAVYRFTPFILAPDGLKGIHGSDEQVAVASLGAAVAFYQKLLERLCGMDKTAHAQNGAATGDTENPGQTGTQTEPNETIERREDNP